MKQVLTNSTCVKFVVFLGDFILLNILFGILLWGHPGLLGFTSLMDNNDLVQILFTVNVFYIPGILIWPILLLYRFVKKEHIIARTAKVLVLHALFMVFYILVIRSSFNNNTGILLHIDLMHFVIVLIKMSIFYVVWWGLLSTWRLSCRFIIRILRRTKYYTPRKALFVGTNSDSYSLWVQLQDSGIGYKTYGYFDDVENVLWNKTKLSNGRKIKKSQYLGPIKDLFSFMENNRVDELYCSLSKEYSQQTLTIHKFCEDNCIRFIFIPNLSAFCVKNMKKAMIGDALVLQEREEPLLKQWNRIVKRTMDIVISSLFLCTIFPIIFICVAVITKLTSPGPVFFKQSRSGMNGKTFTMIKFRSMKVNNDADKVQCTEDDPRKTKFGNFLRKSNIDELPQIINVWRGDMSIVGPRPHMLAHTERYSKVIEKYMVRHLAKPGITGLAQVSGFRGETKEIEDMEGRVECDIYYIEHWSLWLDIIIILRTMRNMLIGDKNAY